VKALSQKRRHPLAAVALLLMGLLLTGGLYAVATTVNQAKADTTSFSANDAEEGGKLFAANCATCHGMGASGTKDGPSLVGVGAAAVDFQVGTGRMPMQLNGPQAQKKPQQFNDEQTHQLAAYVASLGPGPSIPEEHLADVSGKHIYEAMATGPQNMPVFSDANISPESKRNVITFLKQIEANGSPGGADLGAIGPVAEGLFVWVAGLGVIIAFTIWLTSRTS
jgi:ubiquinol-cytochrome c reductase cytochrome c subunit